MPFFRRFLSCYVIVVFSAPAVLSQQLPPESRMGVERDVAGNIVRTGDNEMVLTGPDQAAPKTVSAALPTAAKLLTSAVALPDEGPYSLDFERIWQYTIWGTSIGRSGLIPVDLDGDGDLEIVSGTSLRGGFWQNDAWHVIEYNAAQQTYRKRWTSPRVDAGVSTVRAHSLDGEIRIFVGTGDGGLSIYNGLTLRLERQLHFASAVTDVLLGDADNDGEVELVIVGLNTTQLLVPGTYADDGIYSYGGSVAALGNVDLDAAQELVFQSGAVVEISGSAAVLEWDFSTFSVARHMGIADIDDDGIDEIISAQSWYYIDILEADLKSPKYQIRTRLNIDALLLADVIGDGTKEIIYGDAQSGGIHIMDGTTGVELQSVPDAGSGTASIAAADVDKDGEIEIMWGDGNGSTGADYFLVYGLDGHVEEFRSTDLVGPFNAVRVGDVDDDGTEEIVAVSFESDSGYADGILYIFNGETFELEWMSPGNLFQRTAWTGIHDVEIGDVDGDGDTEIVVGTDRLYDGAIYIIDGKTHAIEREFFYDRGSPIYALDVDDYDDDGVADIIAGGGKEHTGSPGTYAYVIDGFTGAVKWQSVSLGTGWHDVYAVESIALNDDAVPELVVSHHNIFVIDGATKAVKKSLETDYRGFAFADTNGDGDLELWAGTTGGELVTVDILDMSRTTVATICTTAVNSVKAGTTATMVGTIQFACEDDVGAWGLFDASVIWRSDKLDGAAGYANNLAVADRGDKALYVVGTAGGMSGFLGFGASNTDIDDDGVLNHLDNCPTIPNSGQQDTDGDGAGDACNDDADADGDEWSDRLDNCPAVANSGQEDADMNGIGDACNDFEDEDGDDWADPLDNCLGLSNPDQADRDEDFVGDDCDPYPDNPDNYAARCDEAIFNEAELGTALEVCEAIPKLVDGDGDGEADSTDACPETPAAASVDSAGCSREQFCDQYSGMGSAAIRTCLMSDWQNNQPTSIWARDCRAEKTGGSWRRPEIRCRAR